MVFTEHDSERLDTLEFRQIALAENGKSMSPEEYQELDGLVEKQYAVDCQENESWGL